MIAVLVLYLISLLWLIEPSAAAAAPVARPGCQESCGKVSIPYPFGYGKASCYHDQWFEITCDQSSKPFLRKVNLEVLNISLPNNEVRVNSPTASICNSSIDLTSINFKGSPFHFSYKNVFTVMGCYNALLGKSREDILASCTPTCRGITTKGCNGINCCQAPIPVGLDNYTIFTMSNITLENCSYAFLAENGWLSSGNVSSPPVDMKFAPVVLGWVIKNLPSGGTTSSESMCYSGEVNWVQSYTCRCQDGYEGNPFVPGGCKVVDSCARCKPGKCMKQLGGNYICGSGKKPRTPPIILGFSMGGGSSLLVLGSYWLYKAITRNIRIKQKFFQRNGGSFLRQMLLNGDIDGIDDIEEGDAREGEKTKEWTRDAGAVREKIRIFTFEELEVATDNFNEDRICSQGGQGTVHKGILTDWGVVAVRKTWIVEESQTKQFAEELVNLSKVNHKNVVKLLGCCLDTEVPLLVYEFISNGTLSELLYDSKEEFPLSWELRLRIATEVAGALNYLHSTPFIPFYHQDIKSTNILLDDKYRAKVLDFGISTSVSMNPTTLLQDTGSYSELDLDIQSSQLTENEDVQSSQLTENEDIQSSQPTKNEDIKLSQRTKKIIDVYSFGVILVELLTGRKLITVTGSREVKSLVDNFIMSLERGRLFNILDARVIKEGGKKEIMAVANLAKRCLNVNEKKRPTIKEVTMGLKEIRKSHMPVTAQQNLREEGEVSAETKGPLDGTTTSTTPSLDIPGVDVNEKKRPTIKEVTMGLKEIRKSHMPVTAQQNLREEGEGSAETKGPLDGTTTSTTPHMPVTAQQNLREGEGSAETKGPLDGTIISTTPHMPVTAQQNLREEGEGSAETKGPLDGTITSTTPHMPVTAQQNLREEGEGSAETKGPLDGTTTSTTPSLDTPGDISTDDTIL